MKPKQLSNLEQEVMDIIWLCKECTIRDVLTEISKKRKIAYTTVSTIIQRLEDKGFIAKNQKGIAYFYNPKISKESYSKRVAKSFLKNFVNSFGDTAISSFAESIDTLPKKKKDYFLELLDEYGKNK